MEIISFPTLFFIFLFSLYLYLFFLKPKRNSGFKVYPVVGNLPEFLQNRYRFLEWTTDVLARCPTNTAFYHHPGGVHAVVTANPLNVEHMLKTNFENYPKGSHMIKLLEDFLGRGIFNSDGELWKVQRKTSSYEFNTKSLRNFVMENATVEIQNRLVPILEKAAKTNQVLDIEEVLERFGFDNICKLAFNVDPGCLGSTGGSEFMQAFDKAATLSFSRFMYAVPLFYKIKKYFNVGSEHKLKKSIIAVHEYADKIIQSKMKGIAEKKKDEDLLSRFIGHGENSPEFLRDIVISFILAGRDSTSSALSWFFWLLSSRPDVEKNILRELEIIRVRCGGKNIGCTYSFDSLREMHYLHAAISEALRLYPPVPVDTKTCREDDVLPDGTLVGKGWSVTYHAYAMGRMESVWGKDCCEFRPERWLENGTCRQESPFRFPAFHAGPRMCLGKDLAYIQMKAIAATVIERFEIKVQNKDKCPEHMLSLTLKMKGGLAVKVKERSVNVR